MPRTSTTYIPNTHTLGGVVFTEALCKHLPVIYQLRWIHLKQYVLVQCVLQSVSVCFTSQYELCKAAVCWLWFCIWMQSSIFPHDCYMIAALLRCYPTLKATRVEDLAVPHRMQGGDFLQWLPQKTEDHDYNKSLFHALRGPIPSSSVHQKYPRNHRCRGQVVGQHSKVHVLKSLKLLHRTIIFSCFDILLL